jgi:hypothetical protein
LTHAVRRGRPSRLPGFQPGCDYGCELGPLHGRLMSETPYSTFPRLPRLRPSDRGPKTVPSSHTGANTASGTKVTDLLGWTTASLLPRMHPMQAAILIRHPSLDASAVTPLVTFGPRSEDRTQISCEDLHGFRIEDDGASGANDRSRCGAMRTNPRVPPHLMGSDVPGRAAEAAFPYAHPQMHGQLPPPATDVRFRHLLPAEAFLRLFSRTVRPICLPCTP